ncbi:taspase, threonine aspartase, 1 [Coemansia sp. RSA 988]|nr:taspase, threonine aspartase, 1 [Coemansia sp. RSA 988]
MSSDPDSFGAVGAVTSICNPIQAANAVMRASSRGPDKRVGLIPPMFLVGNGAESWAKEQGIPTDLDRRHKITDNALAKYAEYMEQAFPAHSQPTGPLTLQISDDDDMLLDTVGAVCIDSRGVVSAGVSSGGIVLKYPGRIGELLSYWKE